jgi:hypothetical protein
MQMRVFYESILTRTLSTTTTELRRTAGENVGLSRPGCVLVTRSHSRGS